MRGVTVAMRVARGVFRLRSTRTCPSTITAEMPGMSPRAMAPSASVAMHPHGASSTTRSASRPSSIRPAFSAYALNAGRIEEGLDADLVVLDAPWGCIATDALGAIARGDIPGISAVIVDGQVRVLRSRNTPLATRMATVTPRMDWLGGGH